MILSDKWEDYEILGAKDGQKLERWNKFILKRPDPTIFWRGKISESDFNKYDALYNRSSSGGGSWQYKRPMPESWEVSYKDLTFMVKPTGFKHTGIFPEQSSNWDYAAEKIKNANRKIKVLNLFAYTGCATVSASKAGAVEVVHVDASKGMTQIAKKNAELSGVSENFIRYIVDDVFKFVEKEIRRGNKYDAVIMDPPSYGRGTNGQIWKIEDSLNDLLEQVNKVLSDEPLFVLISSYTTNISSLALNNIVKSSSIRTRFKNIQTDELALPIKDEEVYLPCGICARCD